MNASSKIHLQFSWNDIAMNFIENKKSENIDFMDFAIVVWHFSFDGGIVSHRIVIVIVFILGRNLFLSLLILRFFVYGKLLLLLLL